MRHPFSNSIRSWVGACILGFSAGGCSSPRVASTPAPSPSPTSSQPVSVTGSRIPISPEIQGYRYSKSPHIVDVYSESDIRRQGQPDIQSFLLRRGLLR